MIIKLEISHMIIRRRDYDARERELKEKQRALDEKEKKLKETEKEGQMIFKEQQGGFGLKGGGAKLTEFKQKLLKANGASDKLPATFDNFEKLLEDDEKKKKYRNIQDKLYELTAHYKKLKTSNLVSDSVDKEEVLKDFVDNDGSNLFEKMLYQYNTDFRDSTEEIAKNNFYDNVENNDLDPEKELALNIYDKLIFVVVIIILRLAALQATYYFIDRDVVLNIKRAIYYYTTAYTIIFFLFMFIVNVDVFRLRIVFNFLNMHINATGIFGHAIINIIIAYLIYLLILNINKEPARTKLSKNEKVKLKYKLDVLTLTIGIFMVIITLVI